MKKFDDKMLIFNGPYLDQHNRLIVQKGTIEHRQNFQISILLDNNYYVTHGMVFIFKKLLKLAQENGVYPMLHVINELSKIDFSGPEINGKQILDVCANHSIKPSIVWYQTCCYIATLLFAEYRYPSSIFGNRIMLNSIERVMKGVNTPEEAAKLFKGKTPDEIQVLLEENLDVQFTKE